jgi:hypothetical protein
LALTLANSKAKPFFGHGFQSGDPLDPLHKSKRGGMPFSPLLLFFWTSYCGKKEMWQGMIGDRYASKWSRKGIWKTEMCVGWFSYRNSNSAMGHYRNGLDEGACLGIENFGQSIGILGHFGHFSGNDLYRFRMFLQGGKERFLQKFPISKAL